MAKESAVKKLQFQEKWKDATMDQIMKFFKEEGHKENNPLEIMVIYERMAQLK